MIHSRAPAARVRRTPREARPRAVGASSRCVSQKARAQTCVRARGRLGSRHAPRRPNQGLWHAWARALALAARSLSSFSVYRSTARPGARACGVQRPERALPNDFPNGAFFVFLSLCLTFSFCTPARRARARHGLRARRARGHEHHLQAAQARGRLPQGVCGGAHRLTQKHARQPLRRARRGRRRGQRGAAGGKRGGERRAGPARARGGRGGRRRRRCAWEPLGARKAGEARA